MGLMTKRQEKFVFFSLSTLIFLAAMQCDNESDEALKCETLFGAPTENTGLDDKFCRSTCLCEETNWIQPTYDQHDIEVLLQKKLINPLPPLENNPYKTSIDTQQIPNQVCGILFEEDGINSYKLQTFETESAAKQKGALITHFSPCGRCSSLQDLATYMAHQDLTDLVRRCGLLSLTSGKESALACLEDIGYSEQCSEIWYFNILNTQDECSQICIAFLNEPHHLPDFSLNPCLQCDEEKSGPIFKKIAGRTRRNSGLASAICRPCESVSWISHKYFD